MALPRPVVDPPPTATTASVPRSFTTRSASSVTSTGVCMTAPAEGGRDPVRLRFRPPGRAQQERPASPDALDLRSELRERAGTENHAHRKGIVDERLDHSSTSKEGPTVTKLSG